MQTVEEYLEASDPAVRPVLEELRAVMRAELPEATEKISYGIPTYVVGGRNLVHFGGWRSHVSVYPVPAGDEAFAAAAESYRAGRGTLRYSLDRPLPLELIRAQVRFLRAERVRTS